MRYKVFLCYVRRPDDYSRIYRHFMSSLFMEEEVGVIDYSDISNVMEEKVEEYVIRDIDVIKRILDKLGYREFEDKIILEIILKRCE